MGEVLSLCVCAPDASAARPDDDRATTRAMLRIASLRTPWLLAARRARSFATAPPVPRPLHLLLYTYTEDAVEKRAPYRGAHLALALESEQRGELLLGGALADPVDGGVLAFAGGRAVAEDFARVDPYVLNGIVTDWTVREWTVVVGSLAEQVPPPPPFVATYEWQTVGANEELPSGLDIELPLDGTGPRRARIPERWQLSVWTGDKRGFWRCNGVGRDTTVLELRSHAAKHLRVPVDQVSLRVGAEQWLDDDAATAEELGLFARQSEVEVEVGVVEDAAK